MMLIKNVSWSGLALLFFCWVEIAGAQGATAFVPVRAISSATLDGNAKSVIALPMEGGTINLFIDPSVGDVSQFHVDLNTGLDSNLDGTKDNDTDNASHSSFRSGGSFPVNIIPLQGEVQRGIKIKVVGADSKASEAEFTVRFNQNYVASVETFDVILKPSAPLRPVLKSDRDVLKMGEQFTLRIENPPAGTATFAWDLQGDGQVDTQTNVPYVRLEPDAPGILPVRVMFMNATGGMRSSVGAEFTVESSGVTSGGSTQKLSSVPRIDVTVDGLRVNFKPASDAPIDFLTIEPTWDFGDEETSYLLEPEHVYRKSGSYTVKLTLSDINTKDELATAEANVVVRGSTVVIESVEERDGGWLASLMKPFILLFKVVLFVLFILLLITGGVFMFFFMQAKKENITVKDVVLKYKKKLSGEGDVLEDVVKVDKVKKVDKAEVIDVKEVKEKKTEPAPMKLEGEAEKVGKVEKVEKVVETGPGPGSGSGDMPKTQPKLQPKLQPKPKPPAPPPPPPPPTPKKEDDSLPPWLTGASEKGGKVDKVGKVSKDEKITKEEKSTKEAPGAESFSAHSSKAGDKKLPAQLQSKPKFAPPPPKPVSPKKEEAKEVPPWLAEGQQKAEKVDKVDNGVKETKEEKVTGSDDEKPIAFIKADVAEEKVGKVDNVGKVDKVYKKLEVDKGNPIPKKEPEKNDEEKGHHT